MATSDSTPAAAVLVAIDIAKVRNEVLIEASAHKRRRRLLVLNTRAEHDHLIEVLQAYGRPVVCAFEATGNYHRPIAWRLAEAGFEVRLVSSLALARTREALQQRHRDPRHYPHGVAFMDGQYLPMSEAKVSVLDWGFLHSDATYDTVHVWEGRFFRLDLHLDRFFRGMQKLRMKLSFNRTEIEMILSNCVGYPGTGRPTSK
ncbi:transposase [Mesorhizobium sp. M1148]